MSHKRKATVTETISYENADVRGSTQSANTQVPEPAAGKSKRRKTDPKHQEFLRSNGHGSSEVDEEEDNVPTRVRTAAKKMEDAESQSKGFNPQKPRRGVELKADVIKSRDMERQRAEQAEASIEKLKSKNKELSSRSEQQMEKIKRLEISKLAASGQDRAYLQDDDTIRGNIKLLFELISSWALNWAHEDYMTLYMNGTDIATTFELLRGQSKHLANRVLREDAGPKCIWATAGCRLVAEAFLANTIAKLFLARPLNVLMQSEFGSDSSIEEHVHRVRDGMKGTQVETHLWMSTTLRSYYSPDQYADNIVKPITNDHLHEARMARYESVISDWMSQEDSPLTPFLRRCQGLESKHRKAGMIKILHTASKLSLQLWTQDSEVEVIDNIDDQQDLLRLFNGEIAEVHQLMPELPNGLVLHNEEIDLLVRPRLKVTKFNSMYPSTPRRICTKASVVIFNRDVCKDNKAEFEKRHELSLDTTAVQAFPQEESASRIQRDMTTNVHAATAESPHNFSGEHTESSNEDLRKLHRKLNNTIIATTEITQTNQKVSDFEELMAESDEAPATQINTKRCPSTRPEGPERAVIDLTDEFEMYQAEGSTLEPTGPTPHRALQRKESSDQVATTKSIFSRTSETASTCHRPRQHVFHQSQEQNTESSTETEKGRETPTTRGSQAEQSTKAEVSPGKASKASSTKSDQTPIQEDQPTLAGLYQFVSLDPQIEKFNIPLEPPALEDDSAEGQQLLRGKDNFTCRPRQEEKDDKMTPDSIDFAVADDEDGDTTMVANPQDPTTPTTKSLGEVSGDPKDDSQDTSIMQVDNETKFQGSSIHEPVESATDDVGVNDGQDGIGGPVDS